MTGLKILVTGEINSLNNAVFVHAPMSVKILSLVASCFPAPSLLSLQQLF